MWEEQSRFSACLEDLVSTMVFRDSTASRGYVTGWGSGGLFGISPVTLQTQPHSLGPDLCPGNRPGRDYCRRHQWELRTTEVCSLEP